ncbi:MAG TPA: type II secretion system protein [Chthoniobacteraceae bacterium]|nr:type II secretion system protein [Chthoniobacteraceae bacterium]
MISPAFDADYVQPSRAGQTRTRSSGKFAAAFTLVELLVAMSILAMLALVVGQIVGLTSESASVNSKRLDGMGQVRVALDWIGSDMAGRLKRTDVGHGCTKAIGNDVVGFYSEVDSYSGSRRVAAVGYRIQETDIGRGQPFQLERGVEGTSWAVNGGVRFLQAFPVIADADYETLADSILRLEFCYLKTDGTLSNSASSDLSDVSAIVVAFAVLDSTSRKIVSESDLGQLSGGLPDTIEGQDPISGWHAAYADPAFATGVPRPAIQGLRFAQRYFYVR